MEKQIAKASYWLGIVCAVVALAWQLLRAAGILRLAALTKPPISMDPGTVLKGAVLLLVISIASYQTPGSR